MVFPGKPFFSRRGVYARMGVSLVVCLLLARKGNCNTVREDFFTFYLPFM